VSGWQRASALRVRQVPQSLAGLCRLGRSRDAIDHLPVELPRVGGIILLLLEGGGIHQVVGSGAAPGEGECQRREGSPGLHAREYGRAGAGVRARGNYRTVVARRMSTPLPQASTTTWSVQSVFALVGSFT